MPGFISLLPRQRAQHLNHCRYITSQFLIKINLTTASPKQSLIVSEFNDTLPAFSHSLQMYRSWWSPWACTASYCIRLDLQVMLSTSTTVTSLSMCSDCLAWVRCQRNCHYKWVHNWQNGLRLQCLCYRILWSDDVVRFEVGRVDGVNWFAAPAKNPPSVSDRISEHELCFVCLSASRSV